MFLPQQLVSVNADTLKLNYKDPENSFHNNCATLDYLLDIINHLEFIHNRGFVHRDVKPDNTLCIEGMWKLIDYESTVPQGLLTSTAGTYGFCL